MSPQMTTQTQYRTVTTLVQMVHVMGRREMMFVKTQSGLALTGSMRYVGFRLTKKLFREQ